MSSNTFSFLNVHATLAAPGGIIDLGAGAAVAEEGITINYVDDADILKVGADGSPMHSLNGSKAAKVTVRLLKTSPTNKKLADMFNFQRLSSVNWGKGMLRVSDVAKGDVATGQFAAFTKFPEVTYSKDGPVMDWEFNVGIMDIVLGDL